jgi:hypothetical protein
MSTSHLYQNTVPGPASPQKWSDEAWFFSDGYRVEGPLEAAKIFSLAKTPESKLWQVTREGFHRWYPWAEWERYYRNNHSSEASEFAKPSDISVQLEAEVVRLQRLHQSSQNLEPKERSEAHLQTLEKQSVTKSEIFDPAPRPNKVAVNLNEVRPELGIDYNHLQLSGRLRLGPLLNPSKEAMLCFITFGVSWMPWFQRAEIFVHWHLDASFPRFGLGKKLALVFPGLHMVLIYRLAKKILSMESQNHYRATSPAMAFALALFPPFAVVYLQKALNRHWRLHVKHGCQTSRVV